MEIDIGEKYWVRTFSGEDYEVETISLAGNNVHGDMLVNCRRTDNPNAGILWEFARRLYKKKEV